MIKSILDGKPKPFVMKDEDGVWTVYNAEEVEEWMDEFQDVIARTYEGEQAINRLRSVCNTGILSTSIFGGCIVYLMNIGYIQFEIGIPALLGLAAILVGFLNGLRSK